MAKKRQCGISPNKTLFLCMLDADKLSIIWIHVPINQIQLQWSMIITRFKFSSQIRTANYDEGGGHDYRIF
jgi:hypothetical protein